VDLGYNVEESLVSLAPRVEMWEDGAWFTQLYDLAAEVAPTDKDGVIGFDVRCRLLNEARRGPGTSRIRPHPDGCNGENR
jgi:hypothetical protein